LLALPAPAPAADYPSAVVKNDQLKFTLYEADAKKGFYRGTRFDHAGVFGNIEFAGHAVFGPWKDAHDPTNHDDIVGPCEEFGIDSPLGYADAKVGETFLKIGVGELRKPPEDKYRFATKYEVVRPLEWKRVQISTGEVESEGWTAEQAANGYGYRYEKAVSLRPKSAVVEIRHRLANTGDKRIVTDVYNHNFFNVDGDPIGANYSFAFPYDVKATDRKRKFADLIETKDKELRFNGPLVGGDGMAALTGFDPKDQTHRWFEMRHAPSGVRVRVEHDSLAKFNLWGVSTTICPEPYRAIDLKPGEKAAWTITYRFSHEPPKK
jgi:hypothetical protein